MTAKYRAIATVLRERILGDNRIYLPGTAIPSIQELVEEFKVSGMTIRAAVGELVDQGLVTPMQGIGTIVRDPSDRPLVHQTNWAGMAWTTQQPAGADVVVSAEWITVDNDDNLADRLRVERGSPVLRRVRHQSRGAGPTQIHHQWIPTGVVTAILEHTGVDLADVNTVPPTDLYTLMRNAGMPPVARTEVNQARLALPDEVKVLGLEDGAAVLTVDRVTVDGGGAVLEISAFVGSPMKMSYTMPLEAP